MKSLLTCLLSCPLFPVAKSQPNKVPRPGPVANMSLGHTPGKSFFPPCLPRAGKVLR